MAEFTRFAETITVKEDMRVVSITVQPIVSDCTGRIWFTDLMLQEGDRLTGFVINTEMLLQKYREDDTIVAPRFYNGIVRDSKALDIHDNLSYIFLDTLNGTEFMKNAFNLHLTHSSAGKRRKHNSSE